MTPSFQATLLLIGDAIGDAFGAIIEMQDAPGAQCLRP